MQEAEAWQGVDKTSGDKSVPEGRRSDEVTSHCPSVMPGWAQP